MEFLKAVLGFGVMALLAVSLAKCSIESATDVLQEAVLQGKTCSADRQYACRIGDYVIQQKPLTEILADRNLDDYVPSQACEREQWLNGELDGQLVSFCKLTRHPLDFTEADKLNDL